MTMRQCFVGLFLILLIVAPAAAQTPQKPFISPVALPPGPSTWLFGQPYGNTVGAYNFGQAWYSAGQGLHFGIDLAMPCGTPLVAMADGVVAFVDDFGFGSRPHNLLIRHTEPELVVLYGHLLERPSLVQGETVQQGQVVALSGDPDETCDSRPHLHLEIRALNYRTTYNPVSYIDLPWHSLALIGSYSYPLFQQDLTNPRRWMTLDDQPAVSFGGARLNAYTLVSPPGFTDRPPANPPLNRVADPLPDDTRWRLRQLTFDGCCARPWWSAADPDQFYVADGLPGERAAIYSWSAETGAPIELIGQAPSHLQSPDGSHEVIRTGEQVSVWRLNDGANWTIPSQGSLPAISTDNSRLMWIIRGAVSLPGEAFTRADIWISDITGDNARQVFTGPGASALWLDDARLLISLPDEGRKTTLLFLDTRDEATYTLGTWTWMRSLSISPGGKRLMFYLTQQADSAANGIYTIDTVPNAQAQRLNWFGGWRWRDADSVYFIPFDPTTAQHTLAHYHIPTGTSRLLTDPLTMPFAIANNDWSISADGSRILFQSAIDGNLWLLEPSGA